MLINATIHVRDLSVVLAKYKSVMLPISARDGQQRDDVVLVLLPVAAVYVTNCGGEKNPGLVSRIVR